MLNRILLLLLFCLSANVSLSSQDSDYFKHLYVKIYGESEEDLQTEYGVIHYDLEGEPSRIAFPDSLNPEDKFYLKLRNSLAHFPDDKNDILIYVHGMWGHLEDYFEMNTKVMRNTLYLRDSNPCRIAISYIWDSKQTYDTNVRIARTKGELFGDITKGVITEIEYSKKTNKKNSNLNFLCHSMGNTVFESIYGVLHTVEYEKPVIDNLIHAASDQSGNVYNKGEILYEIEDLVNHVHVYLHNNDRTLMLSKLAHEGSRMGLDGLDKDTEKPKNITQINVSLLNDDEDRVSRFSKHRYFYSSETIRKDMLSILNQISADEISNRKYMPQHKAFKLLFSDD